jgi:acylphosphatase
MAQQQRIVRFTGQVQGVGFRFTAIRAAACYDVTGWVRNVPDGTVECTVEGEPAEIDAFLEDLSGRMRGYIRSRTQQTAPATGAFRSFDVKY